MYLPIDAVVLCAVKVLKCFISHYTPFTIYAEEEQVSDINSRIFESYFNNSAPHIYFNLDRSTLFYAGMCVISLQ